MRKPEQADRSAKTGRTRRRGLLILLSLVLLGLIGLGSLEVYQQVNQGVAVENAPVNSSNPMFDGISPGANSMAEKPQLPGEASNENNNANAADDSRLSVTELSEFEEIEDEERDKLAISGAVLDDTGNLLPGITVLARMADNPGKNPVSARAGSGDLRQQTDELGSFTFENLREGEYELAVTALEQYQPATLRVRAGVANAELVLQRFRSVRVFGTITDDVGNPLEGVRVRALGSKSLVLSDVNGAYEVETSPRKAGQPPVLDFSLEGYRDARRRVEDVIGSTASEVQLDVQLEWESDESKVAVYGLVYGPATEPVAGAMVWLSSYEYNVFERTRSSTMGEYRFEEVKVGDGYTLGVEPREKYAAFKSESLGIGPGDLNYDVTLEETGVASLSGILTDLSGIPLGNFMLWASNTDAGQQKPMPLKTDGAGRFRLEQISAGAIKLESRSQPWLVVTGIVLQPEESRRVEVPLDWGRDWLLGKVVDDRGEPIARAKVNLQWSQVFSNLRSESRREVMSDQEGYFALSNLDADEYTVTIEAGGFARSRIQYRPGQGEKEMLVKLTRSH